MNLNILIALVCCLVFGFGFAEMNLHYGWGFPWYARFAMNMTVYYGALITAGYLRNSDGVH